MAAILSHRIRIAKRVAARVFGEIELENEQCDSGRKQIPRARRVLANVKNIVTDGESSFRKSKR